MSAPVGKAEPSWRRVNTWRHRARVRARELHYRLKALREPPEQRCPADTDRDELREGARQMIDHALVLVDEKSGPKSWWYGQLYEETLFTLHAAEVAVTRLMSPHEALTRANSVLAGARPLLARDDPRLALVERMVRERDSRRRGRGFVSLPCSRRRVPEDCDAPDAVANLLKAAHEVEEERAVRSRNFRNRLVRAGAVLLLILGAVCGAARVWTGAIPVCGAVSHLADTPVPTPTASTPTAAPSTVTPATSIPAPVPASAGGQVPKSSCRDGDGEAVAADVALVMLFGTVGAALPVAARLQRYGGSWNPYGLQLCQELIKLPTGSLVALAGLLLLHTGVVPGLGAPHDWHEAAADAVLLGIGQLAFTRTMDRRVSKLVAAAPDEEEAEQLEKVSGRKASQG
ncbi:hypothetical protein ACFU96_09390 [Streptomyces sp. NPDC057620]|uniref:hypothetical protein n=1 Tax=Streptomyces sp. NPDC057620 TaxID=3346185 RepID=UPI0036B1894A